MTRIGVVLLFLSFQTRILAALALVAGCASIEPHAPPLPMLPAAPEVPHRTLAPVEAAGAIGQPLEEVYELLFARARELGADALVGVRAEREYRPAPPYDENREAIGSARPQVLSDPFIPGVFGYEGSAVRTVAGYYWEVVATAIAYEDRP
jgi:hypothetical protein